MAQPADPPAAAKEAKLEANSTSRMMGEAAVRLKRNAAEQANKLQQLEPDLERSTGELALILQRAAAGLAPDADYRASVVREAEDIRGSAHEAEVDLHGDGARKARYLQQKLSELETVSVDAEELRTRMTASIDFLERLKHRMQRADVSGRVEELVKTVRGYLDGMEVIATRTERLAGELDNYQAAIATTNSTPTEGPASARVGGTETGAGTPAIEHRKHRPNIGRRRIRSKIGRRKRTAVLHFKLIV